MSTKKLITQKLYTISSNQQFLYKGDTNIQFMYKLQHTKVKHTLTMANLYSYTFSFQTNFSAMMGQIYVNFSIEIGSQLKI